MSCRTLVGTRLSFLPAFGRCTRGRAQAVVHDVFLLRSPTWACANRPLGLSFRRQASTRAPTKEKLSAEQADIEAAELRAAYPPTPLYDIGSQNLPLLDLHVPVPYSHLKDRGIRKMAAWAWETCRNTVKNAFSLSDLAMHNGIPGLPKQPSKWSPNVFGLSSLSEKAWIGPFRAMALAQYKKFNEAQAKGDIKTIERLTLLPLRETAVRRAKTAAGRRVWIFHGESSPTQCVSARVYHEDLFARPDKPDSGRYAQIVVKFDTLQSLAKPPPTGDVKSSRVVEYIVFERRFWMDDEWHMTAQVYEQV